MVCKEEYTTHSIPLQQNSYTDPDNLYQALRQPENLLNK